MMYGSHLCHYSSQEHDIRKAVRVLAQVFLFFFLENDAANCSLGNHLEHAERNGHWCCRTVFVAHRPAS